MSRKTLILLLTAIFAIAYVLFGAWIAQDTKIILKKAMSGETDYSNYMNQSTYHRINPIERGIEKEENFIYDKKSHRLGLVLPLHFFFVSKVFVTQQYENDRFGLKEPVNLTVRLKSGKWYATSVQIKP